MQRIRLIGFVILIAALGSAFVLAADPVPSNMDILRDKLKADKKLVVAENMQLTEAEAKAFWPIYDEYQAGLGKINEQLKKVVLTYAEAWNSEKVTDETCKQLVTEAMAIEESELQLKKTILPKLQAALPAMKVMRYLQMENKIRALVRFDLAAGVPLAQ
jgi:hypothetical protein